VVVVVVVVVATIAKTMIRTARSDEDDAMAGLVSVSFLGFFNNIRSGLCVERVAVG